MYVFFLLLRCRVITPVFYKLKHLGDFSDLETWALIIPSQNVLVGLCFSVSAPTSLLDCW
jgi:hypothetical protein